MKSKKLRIVIAVNDGALRFALKNHLERSGYAVFQAWDGLSALEVLEKIRPGLILLDLRMPGVGGVNFLERIGRTAPTVPVVVMSDGGVLEEAVEALRSGAWDYVAKSFDDMRALDESIARVLERAELLKDRERYHAGLESAVRERTGALEKSYKNLRDYQALVQEKNEFLRGLLASIPLPVFYKQKGKGFLGGNHMFNALIPTAMASSLEGKEYGDLFPPQVARALSLAEEFLAAEESGKCCEVEFADEEGGILRYAVYMSNFFDHMNRPSGVVGTLLDITDLKAKEARITFQATHDELTGILNRFGLQRYVESQIVECGEHGRFGLVYFGVDNFKVVNDSLGRTAGDKLLAALGERFSRLEGDDLRAGRLGSDEFVLLRRCGMGEEEARRAAGAALEVLEEPFRLGRQDILLKASCGIAMYPDDGSDFDSLVKNADLAMHKAKEQGGGRSQRYDFALTQSMQRRLDLEKMLRKGIEKEEFLLLYQPKIHADTGKVAGMEALIRWASPLGLVPPSEFIPLAEDTGLIVELGKWVLREACREQASLFAKELGLLRLAVNISAHQLQAWLPSFVSEVLEESGVLPQSLELEITESAMMKDFAGTTLLLRDLKNRGVRIAIDDFGTGHSSLFYLKNFPVDTLKIDRSFVHDICESSTDAILVSSIITMAKGLNLETVAEGVEREAQADFLMRSSCTELQGFYYSKPLPADKFVEFVKSRNEERAAIQ